MVFLIIESTNQLRVLSQESESLKATLTQQTKTQLKLKYIASKKEQLQTYMKDDARFSTYYDEITFLLTSNSQPTFSSLKVDNKRQTEIDFSLNSLEELNSLLRFIGSDAFLERFTDLRISAIDYEGGAQQLINIEVKGVFQDDNKTT